MSLKGIARIFGKNATELADTMGYSKQGLYLVTQRPPQNSLSKRRRKEALKKLDEYSEHTLKQDMQKALAAYDRRGVAIMEMARLMQMKPDVKEGKRSCDDFLCGDPFDCPTEICAECPYHRCEFCIHYAECEALLEKPEEEQEWEY